MAITRHNRKSKKIMRRKHSRKYKKKGGGVNGPLALAPFLPPRGPVNVPVPGITNQQAQQYYYSHNGRVVPNPESTNKALVIKRGGSKSRRKQKKCKPKKSRKKSRKKSHKKSRKNGRKNGRKTNKKLKRDRHRGGNLSKIVEAIPGGTDLRDVYYRTTNHLADLYSRSSGYGPINDPPNRNYIPKLDIKNVDKNIIPMSQLVGDGSKQAAKPEFSVKY